MDDPNHDSLSETTKAKILCQTTFFKFLDLFASSTEENGVRDSGLVFVEDRFTKFNDEL